MIKIERKDKKNKRITAQSLEAGNVFSPLGSVEPYLFLGYDAEDINIPEGRIVELLITEEGSVGDSLADDTYCYKVVYDFETNQIKCIYEQSEVVLYDATLQIAPKMI